MIILFSVSLLVVACSPRPCQLIAQCPPTDEQYETARENENQCEAKGGTFQTNYNDEDGGECKMPRQIQCEEKGGEWKEPQALFGSDPYCELEPEAKNDNDHDTFAGSDEAKELQERINSRR